MRRTRVDEIEPNFETVIQEKHENPSLRGPTGEGNENQRKLQSDYFQLKMYHEESPEYCWQGEWKDRRWCLGCNGTSRDEGAELEIRKCQRGKESQRFVYEKVSGSEGGRIRPHTEQRLCLVREANPKDSRRKIALEECDDDSLDNNEIFKGFSFERKFQINPKQIDDHCLTQGHYPKSGELVACSKLPKTRAMMPRAFARPSMNHESGD